MASSPALGGHRNSELIICEIGSVLEDAAAWWLLAPSILDHLLPCP
jgi:hypothetical protein